MTGATGVLLDAIGKTVTPATEAEVIRHAQDVLARIEDDGFPFPWLANRSDSIKACAGFLRETLEVHADIAAGRMHPATLFPDLGRHQDNAVETALERLTEDIGDWDGALAGAVREACGNEAAAYVSGTEGGEGND